MQLLLLLLLFKYIRYVALTSADQKHSDRARMLLYCF